MQDPRALADGILQFLLLLLSLSFHESAHAWMADRMGDPTARLQGRITLNPIPHIDPVGTLLLPLIGIFAGGMVIGWAKPCPTRPHLYRRLRLGQILVPGAGPASNLLLALLFSALYAVLLLLPFDGGAIWAAFGALLRGGVFLNVMLAAFNLIPVPPLDGSWILSWGLPRRWGDLYDRFVEPYGFLLLILLMVTGAASMLLRPVMIGTLLVLRGIEHLAR